MFKVHSTGLRAPFFVSPPFFDTGVLQYDWKVAMNEGLDVLVCLCFLHVNVWDVGARVSTRRRVAERGHLFDCLCAAAEPVPCNVHITGTIYYIYTVVLVSSRSLRFVNLVPYMVNLVKVKSRGALPETCT